MCLFNLPKTVLVFSHKIDLLDHMLLLLEDLECLKFNGEADQCELVSAMSREDDPILIFNIKTRKNAIVEYLDYQIPLTQLNRDMQAAKRD